MKIYILSFVAGLMALSVFPAYAQSVPSDSLNVTGHGKTAIIPSQRLKDSAYDGIYHYSPAVRAGDYVFLSGVVSGAFGSEHPIDKEQFKESLRRSFAAIESTLLAANADMNSIVKMTTYHVFDSPLISIGKREQVEAIAEVKGEFMDEPHAAWTAIGTTGLLPDLGLVEIDIIAYAPLATLKK